MKHFTAIGYNYGFEYNPDFTMTDNSFKNIWTAVIRTIKDFAHNEATYDGWRVKFEADGELLPINIMVSCDPDTGWTDIFYRNKDKYEYLTSTLAQH